MSNVIKFNSKCQCNILVVYLTSLVLNDKDVVEYIKDIVSNSDFKYYIINIVNTYEHTQKDALIPLLSNKLVLSKPHNNTITTMNMDIVMFSALNSIIKSLHKNTNINFLSLCCFESDNKIPLPPEITITISDLLSSDKLFGFYISNFSIKTNGFSSMLNRISSLNNLVFLGFNCIINSYDEMRELINNIKKCKTLRVLLMHSLKCFKNEEDIKKEIDSIIDQSHIKYISLSNGVLFENVNEFGLNLISLVKPHKKQLHSFHGINS